ncbi:MAG TPA: subclass B1 metallo-beta-lactamase [Opitutaceae bacterium]|nr:subclass B1 metallo-beta-lactamase [Opitutaceae bacterium]
MSAHTPFPIVFLRRSLCALATIAWSGFTVLPAPATERLPPAAFTVPAQQITPDLAVRQLQPGLWLHTSWQTLPKIGRYPANGLLIQEGDHLVLVDTAWGEASTQALLDWIDRELHLPVARAIVTHAHDDRMGGAPVLVRRHIPLVGHPLTASLAVAQHWPAPEVLPTLATPGTAVTIGSVEIFFPGAGHTRDNLVVWLPQHRTLFGGCLVKNAHDRTLGNMADADLREWPASLRRLQARYGQAWLVVPGHGEPGGPELLQHTLDLCSGTALRAQ